VILEVTDTGVGMDKNTRQHCLEPFFSTKRMRGGSGLGLAMVYGTAQRHGGRIEIDSAVNQGTTVRLVLPLSPPPQAKPAAVTGSAPPARSLRVLAIDDEPVLREMVKDVLSFHDHYVETAEGGEAGLALFADANVRGQPFEVVITDLGMPGMDGKQVAEKVKAASPNTPVILLTGWGMMLDRKGPGMSNVDALVNKPPSVENLLQVLNEVVRRSRPPQPLVSSAEPQADGGLVRSE
jgi:CheY-like chemotaxis protein